MNGKRMIGAIALLTSLSMLLSGCSMGKPANGASDGKKPDSITVWSMNGDLSPAVLKDINDRFTKQTGVRVKLETHGWDGITTKVTTALTTSTPPDVIDVGNTQLSGYAANGGLLDISDSKSDLEQGRTWNKGLEESATYDGKLYGAPALLAPFAVLYNKTMWAKAGITSAPRTYDELKSDLDAVKAQNEASDFSPMYLCGQDMYSALQWIWANGGEIAKQKGTAWSGMLSSDKSIQGLEQWKSFQNAYSTPASRTLNTDSPDQTQLFAQGKTSAIVAPSTSITAIDKLKGTYSSKDIGSFAIPTDDGSIQPTFTSGSDWVVPAKSAYGKWALEWIKIATSPEIQKDDVYGKLLLNPIADEDNAQIAKDAKDSFKGFAEAAKVSVSTPAAPGWLKVEGNKVLNDFFSSVASGTSSPQQAADKADQQLNELLNTQA